MGPFPQISQTFGIFSLSMFIKKEFIPYFEKKAKQSLLEVSIFFPVIG